MGLKAAWGALWGSKASTGGPAVAVTGVGMAKTTPWRYDALAREGYQKNVVVYRCVKLISEAAAAGHFMLYSGEKEIEEHPLLALLRKPNPTTGGVEFFTAVYAYLLIAGDSFLHEIGPDSGEPLELYTMRPDRMMVLASRTSIPLKYEYWVEGVKVREFEVDPLTGESAIKHLRMWNPLDDWRGMPPLYPAGATVDTHNALSTHNLRTLQNGGRPAGAVIYKPFDESGQSTKLTPEQRQAITEDLRSRLSGPENAGKIILLEGVWDWKEMALTARDMDWAKLGDVSVRDIAQAFGVPAQLVGIDSSLTFANYEQARLALYEDAVIPLMKRVLSDLNEWLPVKYGEKIELRYDWDKIPALVERRKAMIETAVRATGGAILSTNEGRELAGYEEVDGGDEILVPAATVPLGMSGDLPDPNPPSDPPKPGKDPKKPAEDDDEGDDGQAVRRVLGDLANDPAARNRLAYGD